MAKHWTVGAGRPKEGLLWPGLARVNWPFLKAVTWIFVLSRVLFIETASLAYMYLPHAWVETPQGTLPPSGSLAYQVLGGLWVHWDGLWYLSISTFGYQGRPTATAFFPLFPMAMKLLGGGVIGGIVVSLAAFAGGLYFFGRLAELEFGPRVAWFSLMALAFFPTAFYLNAVYSESLFFALAAASLYYLRTQRYWIAGPLAALTTLDTIYGFLLMLPFAWQIWRQEGVRFSRLVHTVWPAVGLLGYMVFLFFRFGDPLVFESAQSNWARHPELLFVTLYQAMISAWNAIPLFFSAHHLFLGGVPSLTASNFFNFLFALCAIFLAVVSFSRIPFYLWMYSVAALLIPFSYPAVGTPLMSMPRLVLEAFPLFLGLGSIMARVRWTRALYFIAAIPLGMLLTALFATAHWVA